MRQRRGRRIGGMAGICLVVFSLFAGFLGRRVRASPATSARSSSATPSSWSPTPSWPGAARAPPPSRTSASRTSASSPYSHGPGDVPGPARPRGLQPQAAGRREDLPGDRRLPGGRRLVHRHQDRHHRPGWSTTLKAPAQWLMDHAKLAWNSVRRRSRASRRRSTATSSPDASAADSSEPGAELDAEVVQEEGGGDPGAAPNDGVPGLDTRGVRHRPGGGRGRLRRSPAPRTSWPTTPPTPGTRPSLDAVEEAAEAAEKTGAIAGALKVVGKVAGVGLKVAGWVGVGLHGLPGRERADPGLPGLRPDPGGRLPRLLPGGPLVPQLPLLLRRLRHLGRGAPGPHLARQPGVHRGDRRQQRPRGADQLVHGRAVRRQRLPECRHRRPGPADQR